MGGKGRVCVHDYKIDKVDGACFVESGIEPVGVDVGWGCAEFEPEGGEGDPVALEVPVGHGEGGDGFDHAEDAVGVED